MKFPLTQHFCWLLPRKARDFPIPGPTAHRSAGLRMGGSGPARELMPATPAGFTQQGRPGGCGVNSLGG